MGAWRLPTSARCPAQVVFEAVGAGGDHGYIALDDLHVSDGACPEPGETPPYRGTVNQKWGMEHPVGACEPWDWGQTCSCPERGLAQSWGCPISCWVALGVSQPCFPPSIL